MSTPRTAGEACFLAFPFRAGTRQEWEFMTETGRESWEVAAIGVLEFAAGRSVHTSSCPAPDLLHPNDVPTLPPPPSGLERNLIACLTEDDDV